MQLRNSLIPVGVTLLGLVSCTGETGKTVRTERGAPARHAVHTEELKQAMQGLQTRTKEEVAAEIYTGSPASPKLDEVARSAGLIADTADHIPDMLQGVTLDHDEQSRFIALAEQLGRQARSLQMEARHGNMAGVREAMNRLNATCDACHTGFRF